MIQITQELKDWYYYDVLETLYNDGLLEMYKEVFYEEIKPEDLELEIEEVITGFYDVRDNSMNMVVVVENYKRKTPIDRYPEIRHIVHI